VPYKGQHLESEAVADKADKEIIGGEWRKQAEDEKIEEEDPWDQEVRRRDRGGKGGERVRGRCTRGGGAEWVK
jgi:hypothetical protein